MSRTYRRKGGDQSHARWIETRYIKYPDLYQQDDKETVRELRKWHSDAGWVMSTPGWFNNQTCTRPLRVMFRGYAANVKRLADIEDAPAFPKRLRRPWYW